jgi:hypothetical protein
LQLVYILEHVANTAVLTFIQNTQNEKGPHKGALLFFGAPGEIDSDRPSAIFTR